MRVVFAMTRGLHGSWPRIKIPVEAASDLTERAGIATNMRMAAVRPVFCALVVTATLVAAVSSVDPAFAAPDKTQKAAKQPAKAPAPKLEAKPEPPGSAPPKTESKGSEEAPRPDPSGKPAAKKPAQNKPAEKKPTQSKPAESQRGSKKPVEPGEGKPRGSKPAEGKPAEKPPKPSESGASAPGTDVVGPQQGAGQRSLAAEAPPPEEHKATPDPVAARSSQAAPPRAEPARRAPHQRGGVPRKPNPNLPPGSPRAAADLAARREIAAGRLADDVRSGKNDAQLNALREADRVLFPRPLDGVESGWSWGFSRPFDSSAAEVVASGLPPDARLEPRAASADGAADVEWLKSLSLPNLPVRFESRVVKYLKFYRDNPQGRGIARVWAQKAGRYAPALKAALAKANLPTDLVWLSLIESGYNPTIVSPVGAAGLWQFMPEAGRLYGLTVDRWVDERLDPLRATDAAVRYLSDLYRRFGSWELAMAAYNMGYGGLGRAIRKFNTNDFWELSRYEAGLPWETTLYVPKILAIAVVMQNKRAFGLDGVAADLPVAFDSVLVDPGVGLAQIAAAAGTTTAALEALNPQFLAHRTPPQRPGGRPTSFAVRVPAGKAGEAARRVASEAAQDPVLEPYVVRFGDTPPAIAAARRTNEERLRQINELEPGESLAAGTVLLVPRALPGMAQSSADDAVVVVTPRAYRYSDRDRIFYRVVAGDTIGKIALALGVSKVELLTWNAIDESARLQPGMALQAFVPRGAALEDVRHSRERDVRVLVAGSAEFFDYFEGLNGRRRITVIARAGDTLASIGKRYGMSVGWMERINRRARSEKLAAGDSLIVYAERAVQKGATAPLSQPQNTPLPPIAPPHPETLPTPSDGSAPSSPSQAAASPGV